MIDLDAVILELDNAKGLIKLALKRMDDLDNGIDDFEAALNSLNKMISELRTVNQ